MKTGTYKYAHQTYVRGVRTYVDYTMKVEIVGERANKHQVKYLEQHASGVDAGTLHWVRKDKVRIHGIEPAERPAVRDDIRLPYKD